MFKSAKNVYKKAKEINADIYHFHDPELLPYGLKLKKMGKIVIFDSHEDIPAQIMDKPWIPILLRKLISNIYKLYETHIVRQIDAVVSATPFIESKFKGRAKLVVTVNNYPKLSDVEYRKKSLVNRDPIVCYAGAISDVRGEGIMIKAMRQVKGKLYIAGVHEVETNENIHYLGKLDRKGVNDLYEKSVVGLCLLKPIDNYINSQPTKMYEYMAAGIPFVCSDFPLWKNIAEESYSGICVDPFDDDSIVNAINSLLENRVLAEKMGENGRLFMEKHYTWENEEKALISLYSKLITGKQER